MNNNNQTTAVEVMSKLVTLLEPLSPEDRHKAITAAMIFLNQPASLSPAASAPLPAELHPAAGIAGLSPKAAAWMKKNSISAEHLEQVFSIEHEGVDVIASRMPSTSKRQQTLEAYVICGLKSYLKSGELSFSDKEARDLCQKVGCYDSANHYNYMKGFGNLILGTKDTGWKLTNPGLNEAGLLIKKMTTT